MPPTKRKNSRKFAAPNPRQRNLTRDPASPWTWRRFLSLLPLFSWRLPETGEEECEREKGGEAEPWWVKRGEVGQSVGKWNVQLVFLSQHLCFSPTQTIFSQILLFTSLVLIILFKWVINYALYVNFQHLSLCVISLVHLSTSFNGPSASYFYK